MPSQTEIRDAVTAQIIQALEAEVLPWRRPWRTTVGGSQPGRHSNFASRKAYQGVNPLLLEFHALHWVCYPVGGERLTSGTRSVAPSASDHLGWKRVIGAAGWSSGSL